MAFKRVVRHSGFVWVLITYSPLSAGGTFGTPSDYGVSGLIDVPSARHYPDGQLLLSASQDERYNQFSITYQAAPWLQGSFRYSGFKNRFYWDRNYEVKLRLWAESGLLPETSVGIRDFAGTGVFASEYIVSSKKIGRTDVTLGIGWGRLSGKSSIENPLGFIDPRFDQRENEGPGSSFLFGDFFSGPTVGVFGGVSHRFQDIPVTLEVEFNPDQYDWFFAVPDKKPESPWSIGVDWEVSSTADFSLSLQHLDEIAIGFTSRFKTAFEPPKQAAPKFISSFFLSQRDLPSQINKQKWYDRLLYDVERSGLLLVEASLSDDYSQALLVVGNLGFQFWSDAISTHIALADLHLPASVTTLYLIIEEGGHRVGSIVVPRPSASGYEGQDLLPHVRKLSGRTLKTPQFRTDFVTGKVHNTINLAQRFQLFDPDDPARYQIYLNIDSEYALSNYWAVRSTVSMNLYHNFDESNRKKSDSVLPKVRSDVVRYLNAGETGIEKLILEGRNSIGNKLHYRVFAGYLETMYAGVGGEVLVWPHRSRLAFGASLVYARQRGFHRNFDLREYDVVTGFLSAYWASPFYNYDVALHAGQYLASDKGLTFEARRTFRSGWQVGVWATLTDVPFDDFGEGSFDKGLYFRIPLASIFGSPSRAALATRMRPIQRDGGQRLEGYGGDIFWDLRGARFDALGIDARLVP